MTLAPAADIAGKPQRRWPIGLLLVAPPVFLVGWMIIWPIVTAITRTVWLPAAGRRPALLARDLRLLLLRPLQPRQPRRHPLDHRRLRRLPRADLPRRSRSTCASPTGRLAAYVQGLAIFPMFVPSIILSYALIRVLGPNGTVDLLLNAVGLPKIRTPYLTPWGPVIGLVWDNIPITVLILLSGLGAVSNQSIEAARDVGAGRWAVLWHIILPRISNSILVADQLHRARHLLRLHAALRPRPRRARDDGPVHAAHLPRPERPDHGDHPGRHHLRLLHRVRALLRPLGREEPGRRDDAPRPHRLARRRPRRRPHPRHHLPALRGGDLGLHQRLALSRRSSRRSSASSSGTRRSPAPTSGPRSP